VGELIDAALKIYRSRFRTLLAAVAVPLLPVVVLSALLGTSSTEFSVDPVTGEPTGDGGDLLVTFLATVLSGFLAVIGTSIATAACFRSISGAYVGDDPDWRESLRFGFQRLWSVMGLTILTTVLTLLGALLCLVGALWPLAVFAVAMPVLLVENTSATGALGRSRGLVRGSGWRVLGIVLLGLLIGTVFQAMVSAPLVAVMVADVPVAVEVVVNGVVQLVATVLVTPFTAALTMALYVDLRVRKEGFDLYLWAQRLGLSATGDFPTQPGAPELPAGWTAPGAVPGAFPPPPGAPPPGAPGVVPPPPPPPPPAPPPPPPPSTPPAGPGGEGGWGPPPAGGGSF
jgi:hypothetical protein